MANGTPIVGVTVSPGTNVANLISESWNRNSCIVPEMEMMLVHACCWLAEVRRGLEAHHDGRVRQSIASSSRRPTEGSLETTQRHDNTTTRQHDNTTTRQHNRRSGGCAAQHRGWTSRTETTERKHAQRLQHLSSDLPARGWRLKPFKGSKSEANLATAGEARLLLLSSTAARSTARLRTPTETWQNRARLCAPRAASVNCLANCSWRTRSQEVSGWLAVRPTAFLWTWGLASLRPSTDDWGDSTLLRRRFRSVDGAWTRRALPVGGSLARMLRCIPRVEGTEHGAPSIATP